MKFLIIFINFLDGACNADRVSPLSGSRNIILSMTANWFAATGVRAVGELGVDERAVGVLREEAAWLDGIAKDGIVACWNYF